ncbi:MAG: diaminopimelate epimerase [Gammaproteobacteria bacterium]
MNLSFTKMHGLGNDFVVIDASKTAVELNPEQIRFIANRQKGIGCDQLLLVESARSADTEFYYRIFNADGSEVEQCGNGARCFARFVYEKGLTQNRQIDVGTAKGKITLYLEANDLVRVNMGAPRFSPAEIPITASQQSSIYSLEIDGEPIDFAAVSMGNPHAVIRVDAVDSAAVNRLGPELESHPFFPERVNVGFMAVRDRHAIDLRVYERGSGETLACGTGACAAVVSGIKAGWLDQEVVVSLPGGQLNVAWAGDENPVWMTGPATFVFEGKIQL